MVKVIRVVCVLVMAFGFVSGCTKQMEEKAGNRLPEKKPEEVVMQFYSLLTEGGKLSNKEALTMVYTKYRTMDPNDFRRWTEDYNKDAEIKILETAISDTPDEHGELIATVKLETRMPSMFGDYFTTTSKMNLVLDTASNEWKIDFMADTMDETDYLNSPAEARAEEDEGK